MNKAFGKTRHCVYTRAIEKIFAVDFFVIIKIMIFEIKYGLLTKIRFLKHEAQLKWTAHIF